MKRTALISALTFVVCSFGQLPFELEAHRAPKTQNGGNVLIQGARVLTAARGTLENTDILVLGGKIREIGRGLRAPADVRVIDARGKVVAPGIIDGHSHRASDGTNEGAESITGEVRIGDVLNPGALNVWQALASGHTAALILHGSANAVGGQSVVIKYKYRRPVPEVIVSDAPRMIKFALGENVTRKQDTSGSRFPRTRMGVEALYRRAFTQAREYRAAWQAFESGQTKVRPRRDLRLETLADVLAGKIWVQCHSYRADEMLMLVRLSQEFGFKIGALQHALEAYKIAPELAKAGVGVSIFVDNWSFKQEGYDSIPWNAAICTRAGVNVSINTDGLAGVTALNIDAAKTMRFGGLTEEEALKTITLNPAKQLGIDHRTGSIEVGKDADLAIWDGHPLSVYSTCILTMVEGEVYFERRDAFGVDGKSLRKSVLDVTPRPAVETPPGPRAESYAIVGATLHPISGPSIPNGTLVVENGRISAVGSNPRIPAGARRIDGRGLHVYPGFFDAYTGMGLSEISGIAVMTDNAELGGVQPDLDAQTALWVESAHYGPARYNGVTHVLSAPSGGTVSGQAAVIHTFGLTTEELGLRRKAALVVNYPSVPRAVDLDRCDHDIDVSWVLGLGGADPHDHDGHDHEKSQVELNEHQMREYYDLLGGAMPVQDTQAATNTADRAIRETFDKAAEYLKKRAADPSLPRDLGYEAMEPYLKGERLVILNARSASSIRAAVKFAQDYKLKAVIAGANEAWKEAKLLAESGIPVIINPAGRSTLSANVPDQPWDPYDSPYVAPSILEAAGVKFAFMSGSSADSMNLAVRVGQHCAYGLSREAALRALTLSPAEIFGIQDLVGSLQAGRLANFVVTDGDPFEMTSSFRYVFVNGHPRPLESRHTMLRNKYQNRR